MTRSAIWPPRRSIASPGATSTLAARPPPPRGCCAACRTRCRCCCTPSRSTSGVRRPACRRQFVLAQRLRQRPASASTAAAPVVDDRLRAPALAEDWALARGLDVDGRRTDLGPARRRRQRGIAAAPDAVRRAPGAVLRSRGPARAAATAGRWRRPRCMPCWSPFDHPALRHRDVPPRAAFALEQAGMHPLLARLFAARGVSAPTNSTTVWPVLPPANSRARPARACCWPTPSPPASACASSPTTTATAPPPARWPCAGWPCSAPRRHAALRGARPRGAWLRPDAGHRRTRRGRSGPADDDDGRQRHRQHRRRGRGPARHPGGGHRPPPAGVGGGADTLPDAASSSIRTSPAAASPARRWPASA